MSDAEPQKKSRFKFKEVPRGPEFERIRALPRRPVPVASAPWMREAAEYLNGKLAAVALSAIYPGPLRPMQAGALREAFDVNGLCGLLRAGSGKTAIAYLMKSVLGAGQTLYVCPAAMRPDILTEFQKYKMDWKGPELHEIPVVSYELFSTPDNGELLDDAGNVVKKSLIAMMAPKLLILDECQRCSDSGSTTAQRFDQYIREHPEVVVINLSGTFFKTSIKDGSHLMEWSLGDRSPLPVDYDEREMWASYLDVGKSKLRARPGALLDFLDGQERRDFNRSQWDDERRDIVRKAVARWIFETPGIIATTEPPVDVRLSITVAEPRAQDPALDEAFEPFRRYGRLPDGRELEDALAISFYGECLGLAFYPIWDPPPPPEYREAWQCWAKWCRKKLKANKRGLDSEARMKDAVRRISGYEEGRPLLEEWENQVALYRLATGLLEPPSVPVWLSDEPLVAAKEWVRQHGGLVWTKFIGLGERLAAACDMPYYGEEGIDAKTGRHIKQHQGGPAVASLAANGTGRNLQHFWSKNFWFCTPTEQALARTHRPGQKAALVTNDVYIGCAEHLRSFWYAADQKAPFAAIFNGDPQRIQYADVTMPSLGQLELKAKGAWSRWRFSAQEDDE